VFFDRSAPAVEAGLHVTLSGSAALDPVSSTTWQNQPAYLRLPNSIADGAEPPEVASQPLECSPTTRKPVCTEPVVNAPSLGTASHRQIAWPQTEFALPPSAGPTPSAAEPGPRLSTAPDMQFHLELIASTAFAEAFKLTTAPADGIVFGLPALPPVASTTLPEAHVPLNDLRIGVSPLTGGWKPAHSASEAMSPVRFLPVRRGAVLPTPRVWARLAALPN
jgi:hypothetical protein